MTNQEIQNTALFYSREVYAAQSKYFDLVIGKTVKILSDFNGQPYGNSKKSLKDTTFIVSNAIIDDNGKRWLWDGNCNHTYIEMENVEFVEEA